MGDKVSVTVPVGGTTGAAVMSVGDVVGGSIGVITGDSVEAEVSVTVIVGGIVDSRTVGGSTGGVIGDFVGSVVFAIIPVGGIVGGSTGVIHGDFVGAEVSVTVLVGGIVGKSIGVIIGDFAGASVEGEKVFVADGSALAFVSELRSQVQPECVSQETAVVS